MRTSSVSQQSLHKNIQKVKKKVNYGDPVGKGYSKMIRYTTTRRIFSLLNRLLLIAKFNMGPKEMERNFISICYPPNKEKGNRR